MRKIKNIFIPIFLSIVLVYTSISYHSVSASTSTPFSFVLLSKCKATMNIGDQLNILSITSNGKKPTWKSSSSAIASVNTYGIVTAKKPGSAWITAKIKDAEASCMIVVNKTKVVINYLSISRERGETFRLSATTSNNSKVTWRSTKRSIATVNGYGTVTALKPGVTEIVATADGTSSVCSFRVLSPTLSLNKTSITLYRGQTFRLTANVSSKISPTWKTNKKNVAIVNQTGTITALKHGTATISATVDNVVTECKVTVLSPTITLDKTEIKIKKGGTTTISATVSSKNTPVWSTSNPKIVSINSKGVIKALQKGKAYLYATEDGTKVKCTIYVTE